MSDVFASGALPPPLQRAVFLALPVDARARAMCVCKPWRDALADASFWAHLDLTAASGVRVRVNEALLRRTVGRARGRLELVRVPDWLVHSDTLHVLLVPCAATLRELCIVDDAGPPLRTPCVADVRVRDLAVALPSTGILCSVFAREEAALQMLRNEPPFGQSRVRVVAVVPPIERAEVTPALRAAVAAHASLTRFVLFGAPPYVRRWAEPEAADAVVDMALAKPLHMVGLVECDVFAHALPSIWLLLLEGEALHSLFLDVKIWETQLTLDSAALLAAALRAKTGLQTLSLRLFNLYRYANVAAILLPALTNHPSLSKLHLWGIQPETANEQYIVALLAALISADAPALTEIDLSGGIALNHDTLPALQAALRCYTHLRTLNITIMCSDHATEALYRDVVAPAAAASNGVLRVVVLR